MAKLSLQEQLLKSGLVSSAQAKTIRSDKSKQQQQLQKNKVVVVNEAKLLAQQAQAVKAVKDRELNHLRKAEADHKAAVAQIKQLIEQNVVAQDQDGIAYHFNDAGKIKTIYVSERMREQLSIGKLGIVRHEKAYFCIAATAVAKIKERDPQVFILLNDVVETTADDPYAAYAIPDDLVW